VLAPKWGGTYRWAKRGRPDGRPFLCFPEFFSRFQKRRSETKTAGF